MANTRKPLTQADMDTFLDLIEKGLSRPEAARAVGTTGAHFRSLSRNDPGFDNAYQAAIEIGRELVADKVMAEYKRRALDPEAKSDTLLHNLAVATVPEFAVFRRQRVEMTGADGGPIEQVVDDGAFDRLRQKLAPVVDISAAASATGGHRNGNGSARAQ